VSNVALHLIGRAVRHSFNSRIDENYKRGRDKKVNFHAFQTVIDWFEAGNKLQLSTNMSYKDYVKALKDIDGLEKLARDYGFGETDQELPVMMEFIVEGLHQNFLLTKHLKDARISYSDAVSYMMDEISDDK
jgi:magnesium chelatase subunit I